MVYLHARSPLHYRLIINCRAVVCSTRVNSFRSCTSCRGSKIWTPPPHTHTSPRCKFAIPARQLTEASAVRPRPELSTVFGEPVRGGPVSRAQRCLSFTFGITFVSNESLAPVHRLPDAIFACRLTLGGPTPLGRLPFSGVVPSVSFRWVVVKILRVFRSDLEEKGVAHLVDSLPYSSLHFGYYNTFG